MKKLIAYLFLFLICFSVIADAKPAPLSNQLNIGAIAYNESGTEMWNNSAAATWAANRFSFVVGPDTWFWHIADNSVTSMQSMRSINSTMEWYPYDVFLLMGKGYNPGTGIYFDSDTTLMKQWAAIENPGNAQATFDSMVYRMKNGSGDTCWVRQDQYHGCTFTKISPGQIVTPQFFAPIEYRVALDYRFPRLGKFFAWRWHQLNLTKFGGLASGPMVDEEAPRDTTSFQVDATPHFPPKDSTTAHWSQWNSTTGHPFRRMTSGMGDWPSGYSYNRICDSVKKLRFVWARQWRQYASTYGEKPIPNFDGALGSFVQNNGPGVYIYNINWNKEGIEAAGAWGAAWLGEFAYTFPTTSSNAYEQMVQCNGMVKACYDIRDSGISLAIWGPNIARAADTFSTADGGKGRAQKVSLGFFLDCLFPGTTKYMFASVNNGGAYGNVDWNYPIDTSNSWSDSWGKFYGVPRTSRDTNSTRGTDAVGQPYVVHKISLDSGAVVQTFCALRYRAGTIVDNSSAMPVTLPSGTWYELNANGTYGSATSGGSSFNLRNGEARIWVQDKTLANTGVASSSAATGACCISGVCSITTQVGCAGTYLGDNTTCSGSPCATPTVTPSLNIGGGTTFNGGVNR